MEEPECVDAIQTTHPEKGTVWHQWMQNAGDIIIIFGTWTSCSQLRGSGTIPSDGNNPEINIKS